MLARWVELDSKELVYSSWYSNGDFTVVRGRVALSDVSEVLLVEFDGTTTASTQSKPGAGDGDGGSAGAGAGAGAGTGAGDSGMDSATSNKAAATPANATPLWPSRFVWCVRVASGRSHYWCAPSLAVRTRWVSAVVQHSSVKAVGTVSAQEAAREVVQHTTKGSADAGDAAGDTAEHTSSSSGSDVDDEGAWSDGSGGATAAAAAAAAVGARSREASHGSMGGVSTVSTDSEAPRRGSVTDLRVSTDAEDGSSSDGSGSDSGTGSSGSGTEGEDINGVGVDDDEDGGLAPALVPLSTDMSGRLVMPTGETVEPLLVCTPHTHTHMPTSIP